MKRSTAVNQMLEEKFILPKPSHAKTPNPDSFEARFASAMGEPDYLFDDPPELVQPEPATGLRVALKEMRR